MPRVLQGIELKIVCQHRLPLGIRLKTPTIIRGHRWRRRTALTEVGGMAGRFDFLVGTYGNKTIEEVANVSGKIVLLPAHMVE